MKRLALAGLWALTGCSVGPVQACKDTAAITCKRIFECYTAQEQLSQTFITFKGATEEECVSKQSSGQCSNLSDAKPCTDATKHYSAAKVAACQDELQKAQCPTIRGETAAPANCQSSCE
jgi:hypothetical protein